jgi:hypothetical protein
MLERAGWKTGRFRLGIDARWLQEAVSRCVSELVVRGDVVNVCLRIY